MAVALIRHRVRDYNAWRQIYDSVAELQKSGGVVEEAVLRAEGDPNAVLVYHRFGSLAEAHAFMQNPQLREAMGNGGVDEGSLRVEFYE